jgi:hypothetical protein
MIVHQSTSTRLPNNLNLVEKNKIKEKEKKDPGVKRR